MPRKNGKKGIPPQPQAPARAKNVPKPKEFRPPVGEGNLRIRLNHLDLEGPWCFGQIEPAHLVDLLKRLKSFESMRCSEVFTPGSQEGKVYKVPDLPNNDALARLTELSLDDQTEIARLRINGKRRLYGFLPDGGPDFYALWWDPEHQVWPSTPRNT